MSLSTWPHYDEDEIQAVQAVLRSGKVNYWTGDEGRQFEKEFAALVGAAYGVAMMNGTVTLEAALKVLDVGAGDEVIIPCHSFAATATAVVAVGAIPVFADVELDSNNVSAETIKAAISPQTKAIIVVHIAGLPCDMDPILALAKSHDLKVIEDCAQAHGAFYKGRAVGSMGDIGSFSFCQDKIITTGGEGGMVVTQSEALWKKLWAYKDHGKAYDAVYHKEHAPGFRWVVESFGSNLRMTEMQAAIGRLQIKKLPAWHKTRTENADLLRTAFDGISALRIPPVPSDVVPANYKFYCYVRPEKLKADWDRDRISDEINARGIKCLVGGCAEIYREKAFAEAGFLPEKRLPNAKVLSETTLMLLIDPSISKASMDKMASAVTEIMQAASA